MTLNADRGKKTNQLIIECLLEKYRLFFCMWQFVFVTWNRCNNWKVFSHTLDRFLLYFCPVVSDGVAGEICALPWQLHSAVCVILVVSDLRWRPAEHVAGNEPCSTLCTPHVQDLGTSHLSLLGQRSVLLLVTRGLSSLGSLVPRRGSSWAMLNLRWTAWRADPEQPGPPCRCAGRNVGII